jgi:glycosyl transferase family 2
MSDVPAVTVIIPTYQRRELVTRAVASVLGQTFRDFELLVVDGGSDDGTERALIGLDERLRYHCEPKRGVAAARNAGIRLARGSVVAFLDSDNRWLPDHLQVVTGALGRRPSAVLVSTCPRFSVAGSERACDAQLLDYLPECVLSNNVGFVSCIAVRRDALLAVGGFDEQLPVLEDNDLWLRLAMRGPFSLVRRRTILKQTTRGGLKERGRRSGAYLTATERYLTRALGELEQLERRDAPELVAGARAALALNAVAWALRQRDEDAACAAAEDVCRLRPDLTSTPGPMLVRLKSSARDREALIWSCATAAAVWPDPRGDAARFLRGYAVMLLLRSGRAGRAARLFAAGPCLLLPTFLVRSAPRVFRLSRARLQELRHRGRETAHVASR